MRVLVGCEFSGVVRDAFNAKGHDAWSCDILPAGGKHLCCDVLTVLRESVEVPWDLAIFHPPCTYLTVSGLHWNKRRPERAAQTESALDFVAQLLAAPVERIALENPIGIISTRIRKPDQIIQPYDFGEDASKATCLWLKGLPHLTPTQYVEPRLVGGKKRWGNQTDSGQNRLGPSEDRWKLRSITPKGVATAMAEQWGNM